MKRNSNAESTSGSVIIYHRECYQDTTNRTNLQRLKVLFQNKGHEVTGAELKINENIPNKEDKSLRSKSTFYNKTKYIFVNCQEKSWEWFQSKKLGKNGLGCKETGFPWLFLTSKQYTKCWRRKCEWYVISS